MENNVVITIRTNEEIKTYQTHDIGVEILNKTLENQIQSIAYKI